LFSRKFTEQIIFLLESSIVAVFAIIFSNSCYLLRFRLKLIDSKSFLENQLKFKSANFSLKSPL
jgi:hypothetical protein